MKILEGLSGGEVLKAQSQPKKSGMNKKNPNSGKKDSSKKDDSRGMPMGAGGPPPGGF